MREKTSLPVIDGGEASITLAEVAVNLGLKSSRIAYPSYQPKYKVDG